MISTLYASIFESYSGSVCLVDRRGESVIAVPFFAGYVMKVKAPFISGPIPMATQSYSAGAESLNHKSPVCVTAVRESVRLATVSVKTKVEAFCCAATRQKRADPAAKIDIRKPVIIG